MERCFYKAANPNRPFITQVTKSSLKAVLARAVHEKRLLPPRTMAAKALIKREVAQAASSPHGTAQPSPVARLPAQGLAGVSTQDLADELLGRLGRLRVGSGVPTHAAHVPVALSAAPTKAATISELKPRLEAAGCTSFNTKTKLADLQALCVARGLSIAK